MGFEQWKLLIGGRDVVTKSFLYDAMNTIDSCITCVISSRTYSPVFLPFLICGFGGSHKRL